MFFERVQAAERERAVAVARVIEERRRRRLQLALAASIPVIRDALAPHRDALLDKLWAVVEGWW